MTTRAVLLTCCFLALSAPARVAAAAPDSLKTNVPSIGAARFDGSIKIDGRLDEPAWQQATPATTFTQRDPAEGTAASESTEVRVLIGDESLFVGARLYDREPKKIRARLVRRDEDLDSDYFVVFVDGYHDRVNAVMFRVNPLGCMNDAVVNANGDQDLSWDPVWHAHSSIDE